MFGSIKKLPTECPHCGFVQNEPAGLISTYCRGCGDHYTVAPRAPLPAHAKPSISERVREKILPTPARNLVCHKCGHEHEVRNSATNACCPACGTTIVLHDVEILTHSTQIVQTRGNIHVGPEGYLNSTRVTCGNAFVEGRIAGKVTCEHTLRLRGNGLCRAQITAGRLIVDRGTTLRFTSKLRVGELVIRGRVEAGVECAGALHIGRYGGLEGDVRARAMIVDKGGFYAGDVQVCATIIRPEADAREDERDSMPSPGWQAGFAFG